MYLAVITIVALLFCIIVFFGAPYLPTLRPQALEALKLLNLKPGQTLIELGSGDGRVLRLAAQRGINVVGYELNPILVLVSYVVTFRQRRNVKIIWGNYWNTAWPPADGVYAFLIQGYMERLNTKVAQYQYKPVKLVSLAYRIKGKKPTKESGSLILYNYK